MNDRTICVICNNEMREIRSGFECNGDTLHYYRTQTFNHDPNEYGKILVSVDSKDIHSIKYDEYLIADHLKPNSVSYRFTVRGEIEDKLLLTIHHSQTGDEMRKTIEKLRKSAKLLVLV